MQTILISSFGMIELYECATGGCASPIALTVGAAGQARRTHQGFFCSAGHRNVFNGETTEERQMRERAERAEAASRHEAKRREEAERRLADEEREKVRIKRELHTERRHARAAVKTSATLVAAKGRVRAKRAERGA